MPSVLQPLGVLSGCRGRNAATASTGKTNQKAADQCRSVFDESCAACCEVRSHAGTWTDVSYKNTLCAGCFFLESLEIGMSLL